ncbi:MAG: UDP-N-acetylmuramate--L-alanine ligase [Candidatus Omnitrophica bacterium]|nr:UDP-N-acetylmuramate--L-alanine ligase [Candidatus Omnitrophota bacterium]
MDGKQRIHFVGVAGIGMSGLAKALKSFGYNVSGSDVKEGVMMEDLRRRGIPIFKEHRAENAAGADLIVYSSAIRRDNPEKLYAEGRGIEFLHRSDVLAHFIRQGESIGILGTHGKTTTSAMASFLMTQLGLNPTCFVGGIMANYGDNVLLGGRQWMVAEIDESDATHLKFRPTNVILTNLEEDHLDFYAGLDDIKDHFRRFFAQLDPDTLAAYCSDCPNARDVMSGAKVRKVTYGLNSGTEYSAADIQHSGLTTTYRLLVRGRSAGLVRLNIPGRHNVLNSLGNIALFDSLGIPLDEVMRVLPGFKGVKRRLELKLDDPRLAVVDDYAHHPTEVSASLDALKASGRPITCVFQPHRFSRALSLARMFGPSFASADRLILTEIYAAGEVNTRGVDSGVIFDAVRTAGHPGLVRLPKEQVTDHLLRNCRAGEIIAFLGAGDITEVADHFVEAYKNANPVLKKAG